MFKAQTELEDSDEAALAESEGSSARNTTEAIATAVAARTKRAAGDNKLELNDLKAAVKFHPHHARQDGLFEFSTKGLCLQFLATVSPAWDTLLPAVSEPEATVPPPPPHLRISSHHLPPQLRALSLMCPLSQAERRRSSQMQIAEDEL